MTDVQFAPPGVWCLPCLRTFMDGRARIVSAAYIWTMPGDHETPLCVRCIARWWGNAQEEPDFMPAQVSRLHGCRFRLRVYGFTREPGYWRWVWVVLDEQAETVRHRVIMDGVRDSWCSALEAGADYMRRTDLVR